METRDIYGIAEEIRPYAERYCISGANEPIDWETFLVEIDTVRQITSKKDLLFRGHGDASWEVAPTLDRSPMKQCSLFSYLVFVDVLKTKLESLTGRTWASDFSARKYLCDKTELKYRDLLFSKIPDLEFQIYLRHHGCPSPLLDWTRSPFVAAFFAFSSDASRTCNPAIIAYSEYTSGAKGGLADGPKIVSIGPNIKTHPRHFAQQAEYTMAVKLDDSDQISFARHEDVLNADPCFQDTAFKFVLKSSEREKVLRFLHSVNINDYTLYQSEESLIRTEVSLRELRI